MFAVVFAAAVAMLAAGHAHAQDALMIGNTGNVGLGIDNPERQLHLRGSNATFRMDRTMDTAAFLLTRIATTGTPWKTFVVGTNAAGPNNGEFIINDLGAAVSGGGARRLTITNTGDAHFTGTVRAPSVVQSSSARFKREIETLGQAGQSLQQLRGVRFVWKDTGRASLGLIAEEVAAVFPELVERDAEDGAVAAVNYSALVAVLVEAFKEQQVLLEAQETQLAAYRAEAVAQQARMAHLENRLAAFETLEVRLNQIEGLLIGPRSRTVAVSKP